MCLAAHMHAYFCCVRIQRANHVPGLLLPRDLHCLVLPCLALQAKFARQRRQMLRDQQQGMRPDDPDDFIPLDRDTRDLIPRLLLCVRACVRACVRVCACARVRVCVLQLLPKPTSPPSYFQICSRSALVFFQCLTLPCFSLHVRLRFRRERREKGARQRLVREDDDDNDDDDAAAAAAFSGGQRAAGSRKPMSFGAAAKQPTPRDKAKQVSARLCVCACVYVNAERGVGEREECAFSSSFVVVGRIHTSLRIPTRLSEHCARAAARVPTAVAATTTMRRCSDGRGMHSSGLPPRLLLGCVTTAVCVE